jgi:TetR/AcrR family transcriptional regulator, transcriptional repressor for nem operon
MRVDRKTQAAHRAAILHQASELFRRGGIERVGVADITRAAGLTHGAFYGHFPSKAALAAEACQHSMNGMAELWRNHAAEAQARGQDPLGALIDAYLSPATRDTPEQGCALSALGAETSRDPDLRAAMASGVDTLAQVLVEVLTSRHPHRHAATNTQAALAVMSAMSGGLILARTLAADPERSNAALAAAAALARRAAE